jgi:hypothetical protein
MATVFLVVAKSSESICIEAGPNGCVKIKTKLSFFTFVFVFAQHEKRAPNGLRNLNRY